MAHGNSNNSNVMIGFQDSPRTLFFIDGMGAIVSAIILGILLPKLEYLKGMPVEVVHYLAMAASVFAIYSLTCYLLNPDRWAIYLRWIGIINLTYCAVSIGLVFYYQLLS